MPRLSEPSPYVEFDRSQWRALRMSTPMKLTEDEVLQLRGLGEKQIIRHPDILILEGLNVLQTGPTLMVSDLFDFSVYVDARIEDIEQWYISRFLSMRAGAFADPASHFHHYATLTDDAAVFAARDIWHSINRPNLIENILPTRPRATLVLRKDADHSINRLRLRKL